MAELLNFDPTQTLPSAPIDGVLLYLFHMPRLHHFQISNHDAQLIDDRSLPILKNKATSKFQTGERVENVWHSFLPTYRIKVIDSDDHRDSSHLIPHAVCYDAKITDDVQKTSFDVTMVESSCIPELLKDLMIWTLRRITKLIQLTNTMNMLSTSGVGEIQRQFSTLIDSIRKKHEELESRRFYASREPRMIDVWRNELNQSIVSLSPLGAISFSNEIDFDVAEAMELNQKSQNNDPLAASLLDRLMIKYLAASHLEIVPKSLRVVPYDIIPMNVTQSGYKMIWNKVLRMWSWMTHYYHRLSDLAKACEQHANPFIETIMRIKKSGRLAPQWAPEVYHIGEWSSALKSHSDPNELIHSQLLTRYCPSILFIYERLTSVNYWLYRMLEKENSPSARISTVMKLYTSMYDVVRNYQSATRMFAQHPLRFEDFAIVPSKSKLPHVVMINGATRFQDITMMDPSMTNVIPTQVALGLSEMIIAMIHQTNLNDAEISKSRISKIIELNNELRLRNIDLYPIHVPQALEIHSTLASMVDDYLSKSQ